MLRRSSLRYNRTISLHLLLFAALVLQLLLPAGLARAAERQSPAQVPQAPADYMTTSNPNNQLLRQDFTNAPLGWAGNIGNGYSSSGSGPAWWIFSDNQWHNSTGGSGNFLVVGTYSGGVTDQTFILPPLDFSGATAATLSFKSFINIGLCNVATGEHCATGTVDVSTNNGASWSNVATYAPNTGTGSYTLNLTSFVQNQSAALIRFHWLSNNDCCAWTVDDLLVEATTPPAAPTGLTATPNGTSQVDLSWQAVANASGYRVETSANGVDQWSELKSVGSNATQYSDIGLTCGTKYYYRVRTFNTSGVSNPSAAANATTAACAPGPALEESFGSGALPTGWQVQAGNQGGAWYFNNPRGRTDGSGGTTGFAIADINPSSNFFWGAKLLTPAMDLTNRANVVLTAKTQLINTQSPWYPAAPYVDISTDGGNSFPTTLWHQAEGNYGGQLWLDLTPFAAGKTNVVIRFRFDSGLNGRYWIIDDVRVGAPTPTGVPTNFAASLDAKSTVQIGWTPDKFTDKVQLERSVDSGATWKQLGEFTPNVTTYADDDVLLEKRYDYRVRAVNAVNTSAYSPVATVNTPARSQAKVDVKFGIYYDPNSVVGRAAQFENMMYFFARTVYEASNSGVLIRRVTFYPGNVSSPDLDGYWTFCADPNGCSDHVTFDASGRHIYLYDRGAAPQGDQGALFSQEQRANTIAHEFGHYYFALGDEDTTCSPCVAPYNLMSWVHNRAVYAPPAGQTRDYRWLNFSTARNAQFTPAEVSLPSGYNVSPAQYKGFSAWAVLSKLPAETGDSYRFRRELAPYAPANLNELAPIELDTPAKATEATSLLEVCWNSACKKISAPASDVNAAAVNLPVATVNDARAIVIERSAATVAPDQLADFKATAKRLVDLSEDGVQIAVFAFDGQVSAVQPLTALDSQTTRENIKTAIDGITLGDGDSALGDALAATHDALLPGVDTAGDGSVVYLISSGQTTTGAAPVTTLTDYQTGLLPIFAFDYGAADDSATTLQQLTAATDGDYYPAATGLGSLLSAAEAAHAKVSLSADVTLASATTVFDDATPFNAVVTADDTLQAVTFHVLTVGDAAFTLMDPNGGDQALANCESVTRDSGPATYCATTILTPTVGDWTLSATAPDQAAVTYWVKGAAKDGETTYQPVVDSTAGFLIHYPEGIKITAAAKRSDLMTGINLTGELVDPFGTLFQLPMRDDGVSPDETAGDGVYSALYPPRINGDYQIAVRFDNKDGNGEYTQVGIPLDPTVVDANGDGEPDGGDIVAPEPQSSPVGANFNRYADLVVTVTGAPVLGPNGERAGDLGPTELDPDNTPKSGGISVAEPSTFYKVTVPADFQGEFFVRVGDLAEGMVPVLSLVNSNETWSRRVEMAPDGAGLAVKLGVAPGDTVFIEVLHADPSATSGLYKISAGARLPTDTNDDPEEGFTDELSGLFAPGASSGDLYLPLIMQ